MARFQALALVAACSQVLLVALKKYQPLVRFSMASTATLTTPVPWSSVAMPASFFHELTSSATPFLGLVIFTTGAHQVGLDLDGPGGHRAGVPRVVLEHHARACRSPAAAYTWVALTESAHGSTALPSPQSIQRRM